MVLLNSLANRAHRTYKMQCFSHLQAHNLDLDLKFKKLEKHYKFDTKHKILKAWARHVKRLTNERELEEYERRKKAQIILENKSQQFKDRTLQLRLFKLLRKYMTLVHAERQIEQEHENRKNQIDEFFSNLRNKATREKEMEEQQNQIAENNKKLRMEL